MTVFINHRLEDSQGRFLGVTGVGLSMDRIGILLQEHQGLTKRVIYMINSSGLIQVHPNTELVEKINVFEQPGIRQFEDQILTEKN